MLGLKNDFDKHGAREKKKKKRNRISKSHALVKIVRVTSQLHAYVEITYVRDDKVVLAFTWCKY